MNKEDFKPVSDVILRDAISHALTGGSPDARFERLGDALSRLSAAMSAGDQHAISEALATVRSIRDSGRARQPRSRAR